MNPVTMLVACVLLSLLVLAAWLNAETKRHTKTRESLAVLAIVSCSLTTGIAGMTLRDLGAMHELYYSWYAPLNRLLDATIDALERGNSTEVLAELKFIEGQLRPPSTDNLGFAQLADNAAARLGSIAP